MIEGSDTFFNVTKAVHNALQGAETQLDDDMRQTYWERMHANAGEMPDDYDVVIVHDPQPVAMLQAMRQSIARDMQARTSRDILPASGEIRASSSRLVEPL